MPQVLCQMDVETDSFTESEENQNQASKIEKFKKFEEDTILVFNNVANQKYPEDLSRDQKKDFRRKYRCYTIKDGVFYYLVPGVQQ